MGKEVLVVLGLRRNIFQESIYVFIFCFLNVSQLYLYQSSIKYILVLILITNLQISLALLNYLDPGYHSALS